MSLGVLASDFFHPAAPEVVAEDGQGDEGEDGEGCEEVHISIVMVEGLFAAASRFPLVDEICAGGVFSRDGGFLAVLVSGA